MVSSTNPFLKKNLLFASMFHLVFFFFCMKYDVSWLKKDFIPKANSIFLNVIICYHALKQKTP